ncbi:choline dehydrogenase [Truncatella angustata]|uniref:Choline dehydrogenase n=1 Tax=Truncatella angustata TaxID=152316 RepID=A0A9P8UDT1_9PEZI|nr:choline dehydrogenase [Truncatella angustata]KAH6648066.1 choline dehydrogenase [Truncatella angustata]
MRSTWLNILAAALICHHAGSAVAGPIPDEEHNEKRQIPVGTYDYVIVGGGTAGLTLAARLSEDSNIQVAVLEAGTYYQAGNPLLSSTPAGDVIGVGASPLDTNLVDWNFVTTPQSGANNRRIHYARGKCLGGSSARNFMIYQRGTKQSYQKWADAIGDSSYTWDNWLPYFKKSVEFHAPSDSRAANASAEFEASAFDDSAGPLQVGYANWAQPFSSWMEPSLNEIGVPPIKDFNSGSLLGAQYCADTLNTEMKRESSQTSFLDDVKDRPNLKVIQFALAKKILFDNSKKANGVTYQTGLLTFTIRARKEVILSAGAFQSPQLLMVSGVGPAAILRKYGISVIADRPGVGQGMQDHVFFGPTHRVNVQTLTRIANDPIYLASEFLTNYPKQQGPLTNPICDFLGWEKIPRELLPASAVSTLDAQFPPDWPELEYLSAPGYVGDFSNLLTTQPKDGYQYATILGGLVAPLSRGTVTITSADTNVLPQINPNWLTDPTDVAVAIATYKRLRAAFASDAMSGVLAEDKEYFPGPAVQTDAQILQTIRNTVMTIWHASCTCRMGKKDDVNAVVDSDAKVIGVTGLRVVDASSFALLPPGHPQSTVYALAEKIAAQIRAGR